MWRAPRSCANGAPLQLIALTRCGQASYKARARKPIRLHFT